MVSFVSYVLRFKNDGSPIGDVARDILADPIINSRWGYMSLIKHLLKMNAIGRVYDILADTNTSYVLSRINKRIIRRPPIE